MTDPTQSSKDSLSRLKETAELYAASNYHFMSVKISDVLALIEDAERLNSKTIRIEDRDEFGHPSPCIHIGINLRAAIDAAIKERS